MKFFTKKAKIIFLVIILIGAVLLAYNSLNHNLGYLDLNKNSLGSSSFNEGFTSSNDDNSNGDVTDNSTGNQYETRDAPLSSPLGGLQEDINNYFHGGDATDATVDNKKKNKRPRCHHRHHRHSDCPYYANNDDDNNDDNNGDDSYASSDSYDKFNNNSSLLSGISTLKNTIMNDFDAKSSYSKANTNSGAKGKKAASEKKKSQIPKGDEDLYILKSEIVPPVCPVCPSVTPCPNKPAPPCPPCGRCPESPFECKKVPNYTNNANGFLPMPVLNDFSTFGM